MNVANDASKPLLSNASKGIVKGLKNLTITSTAKGWFEGFNIPNKALLWGFGVIFFIMVIVGVTVILQKRSVMSTPENVGRISGTQAKEYSTQLAPYNKPKQSLNSLSSDSLERCLVNYAPLTVANAGYLGPDINGVYNEGDAIRGAIKAGARCFVLHIDFHEDDTLKPPLFAQKGEACLLMRDGGGVIRCLNSGSILRVAQALSDSAYSDMAPNKNDPVILILYFVKAPTPNTKEYLRYLSSVAKQLAPLSSYHLGQTPEGIYNRQGRQNELLYSDVKLFERKLLIFSNADTSLFRNTKSVGLQPFSPREDLDYWVHLRMFKQSETDLGVTQIADDKTFVRGMVENVSYYSILPEKEKTPTVDKNKIRWVMAISPPGTNPTLTNTKSMLDSLGVQCIPYCLFHTFTEDEITTLNLWNASGWRFKPKAIRFRKPEPVKPKAPSPQLNAQHGKITSPSL